MEWKANIKCGEWKQDKKNLISQHVYGDPSYPVSGYSLDIQLCGDFLSFQMQSGGPLPLNLVHGHSQIVQLTPLII